MAARSALECFLQLAGEFVGRGLYRVLHDLSGQGERLVYSCFDGGLANRDEPGMVSFEVLSRLVEFPRGSVPPPNHSGMTRRCGLSIRSRTCGRPSSVSITAASNWPIMPVLCSRSMASRSASARSTVSYSAA